MNFAHSTARGRMEEDLMTVMETQSTNSYNLRMIGSVAVVVVLLIIVSRIGADAATITAYPA
jgi:hypothetical protein